MTQGYQKSVLPNGFEIHTHRIEGAKKVYADVRVKSGSNHEPAGKTGIAHYLEHMFGYGSEKYPEPNFLPSFLDEGGDVNMTTFKYATNFWRYALPRKIPRFLEVVSDVLKNPMFNRSHVDKERESIITEEEAACAETEAKIALDLNTMLFGKHKLSVPVIGFRSDIANMNYEDLKSYVNQHYKASNMFLVATGDVKHDEYVRMAEEYFGDMPLLEPPEPLKPIFPVSGTFHSPDSHGYTYFRLSFPTRGRGSETEVKDIYSSIIIARALFYELRMKQNLLYTPQSGLGFSPEINTFEVSSNLSPENLKNAMAGVLGVLEDIYQNIDESDLQFLRNIEEESFADDSINPQRVGEMLANGIVERGYYISFEDFNRELSDMTLDDVKDFVRRLISVDLYLAVSGPCDDIPQIVPMIRDLRTKLGLQIPTSDVGLGQNFNRT